MKIAICASEASPYAKSGGLGDVMEALPRALARMPGNEVTLFLPYYNKIKTNTAYEVEKVAQFRVQMGWRQQFAGLMKLVTAPGGVTVYFIDNDYYFGGRTGAIYGDMDDGERFAYFSKACLDALVALDSAPDVIQCNDWQTGMIPVYLKACYRDSILKKTRCMYTIHNIEYQGWANSSFFDDMLALPWEYRPTLDMNNSVNVMKGAIEVADTGPGVPYERQDSIFSSSVEDAPCNDIEVALSVVADYVKAHHGEVFYTARPAGGSLMTVLLPTDYSAYPDANIVADTVDAGDADDSADLQPDSVTSADFSLPPDPVVLVVNDNEAVRNFMADRLRPYFHVVVAENARMARGKIDAMMPDAIVCEAHMDGDDGVELLRSLKGNFNSSHVPFFLVSSPSVSDLGSDVDCFGADGLIVKPINYASLVARVRRAEARVLSLRVNFAKDRGIIRAPQADDAAFMATFIENVEVNAARANFGIEELAVEMKMGRNDLHRRLVQLTGCTPGEYIKLWRLNQAMLAITGGRETPVQAMQNAGVSDVAYFNKCFMRLYGSAIAKAMPASIA